MTSSVSLALSPGGSRRARKDDGGDDDGGGGAGASDGGAVRAPFPDARLWRYEEAGSGPSKAKFSVVLEVEMEWTGQMLLAYLNRMARSPMSTDRDDAAPGVVAGPVPGHLNRLRAPQLGVSFFPVPDTRRNCCPL